MWRLERSDSSIFRDGFETQWDAVITAKKLDGTSFSKAEALNLKSGTKIRREWMVKQTETTEYVSQPDDNGKIVRRDIQNKISLPTYVVFTLIEY